MHAARFRKTKVSFAILALAAFVAAGCGSDSDSKKSDKVTGDDTANKDTSDAAGSDASADSGTENASSISAPGVDLRITLDRLLAEHASLAWVALTKTIAKEGDADATVAALSKNTDDLAAAVGSVYGDDAAAAFKAQWEAHIGMFVAYATGVATKDKAAQEKARTDLQGYQKSFAKFLNTAAGLDAKAAEGALGMHVTQLTTAIDQFGAGDYAKSYATERVAYGHMFATGDALAAAITTQKPDKFGYDTVATATADTRVLLDQQLGEHAFLAAVATTKAMSGAKDGKAALGALDANTVALGTTIGSVYGKDAQEAFLAQWRAHIGMFAAYATALAKDDDAGKQKAADDLSGYTKSFGKFLGTATGGDSDAFQAALEAHVQQLAGALDAADSGDANKAWDLEREAYAHMYMTGDAILTAIVKQNPDKFPAASGDAASGDAAAADPNPADADSSGGGDTMSDGMTDTAGN
ncbi:MAG: hypothetical protein JWM98_1924 [Thermoleophilia bacterium]|nr:hypothetical protein [Thermoleophilia bacterium]